MEPRNAEAKPIRRESKWVLWRRGEAVDSRTLRELSLLLDQDVVALDRLIGQYLSNTENILKDIRVAVSKGSGDDVVQLAHALKGTSGLFGARFLAHLCRRLENAARGRRATTVETILHAMEGEFVQVRDGLQLAASQEAGS